MSISYEGDRGEGETTHMFIGPFWVLEWVAHVVYSLESLDRLASIHDVFYVTM